MAHIKLVGIELEGGWNRSFEDVPFIRDVSIEGTGGEHEGELVSPPLPPNAVDEWVKAHYPDCVNDRCGLHIHISFKDENKLDYSRCTDMDYYRHFLKGMENVGKGIFPDDSPFWPRLKGENRFCRKEFIPHRQINLLEKSEVRRTQINFPYSLHKTIECRLLPCFPELGHALIGINGFLNLTEDYLKMKDSEKALGMVVRSKKIKSLTGTSSKRVDRPSYLRF